MNRLGTRARNVALIFIVCSGWTFAQNAPTAPNVQSQNALNAVPGYGVFDYLSSKVTDDGKVVLLGEVVNPVLKTQAEKAVSGLPGVKSVENDIEVLPASKDDDAVRKSVYNVIYRGPVPSIYEPQHSIHIVVRAGEVTLEGTVKSEIDRILIGSAATGAGNVFGLTNHLVATAPDSDDAQWHRAMAGGPATTPSVLTPSVAPEADK